MMEDTSVILWPVFLREKGDTEICMYSDILELQSDLERTDIENEEFEAWDHQGRPLKLSVQEPTWLEVKVATSEYQASFSNAISELASVLNCEGLIDADSTFDQQVTVLREQLRIQSLRRKWWRRMFHW